MPILRSRGGTSTPPSGAETIAPPIRISPAVGCSRPAMQRSVVVLPQPEGPSKTTISPAAAVKLTSFTAGLPWAKTLDRRSTRSSVDMEPSCCTPHPNPPPQGGRERNRDASDSLPLEGGGLGRG